MVFVDATSNDLWTMNADGSNAALFLKHPDDKRYFFPIWFRGGNRIAYVSSLITAAGAQLTVESRDRKGGDPVVLLDDPRAVDLSLQNGRLLYSVREPSPNEYDSNLWELRYDEETGKPTSRPRRLTDWTGFFFVNPQLTADGNRFFFLNGRSQSDIYVGELTSGGSEMRTPQRLTLNERVDWPGGWSADSKTIYLYSDRNGNFDIYRQNLDSRNAEPIATGTEEKWAPQPTPDGKWILYMQWPKVTGGAKPSAGKLMRIPASGGPAEAVMDIKGHGGLFAGDDPTNTVSGFPSFRCPPRTSAACVLAEKGENETVFTAFDPVQGRKAVVAKVAGDPSYASWDLSPDGANIAITIFSYKASDMEIVPVNGGAVKKMNAMPWTELSAVAWSADGKSLFLGSYSSRGTAIVRMPLVGGPKLLFKQPSWDIFTLVPSPDGRYLAFGPTVGTANAWTIPNFPRK